MQCYQTFLHLLYLACVSVIERGLCDDDLRIFGMKFSSLLSVELSAMHG